MKRAFYVGVFLYFVFISLAYIQYWSTLELLNLALVNGELETIVQIAICFINMRTNLIIVST